MTMDDQSKDQNSKVKNSKVQNSKVQKFLLWAGVILVLLLSCFLLLYILEAPAPSILLSSGFVAILSAIIGVILTVVVTAILLEKQAKTQVELLEKQTDSEKEKEKDIRIFQTKINVYSKFIGEMWEIISDDDQNDNNEPKSILLPEKLKKLRKLCFKELVFYLNAEQVKSIAEEIKKITTIGASEDDIQDAMKDITYILQKSVYSKEEISKEEIKETANVFNSGILKDLYGAFNTERQKDAEKEDTRDNDEPSVSNGKTDGNSITFWHFNSLGKEQMDAFKKDNWVLNLIEYGEDWRTNMLMRVKPNDVVFLFQRGGAGYIGAFRVVINETEKKHYKILKKEDKNTYSDDEIKKYDIYDSLNDGATLSSNLFVEPIAFNYKGIGYLTVRRRTIERFADDPAAISFILEGFGDKGRNKDGKDKIDNESPVIIITKENKKFLNGLWDSVPYLIRQRKAVDLMNDPVAKRSECDIRVNEWRPFGVRDSYRQHKNWEENIYIDTMIDENDQWKIYLFYGKPDLERIEKNFSSIVEKYKMEQEDIDGCKRYATKPYKQVEIANELAEFRKMVEEAIRKAL